MFIFLCTLLLGFQVSSSDVNYSKSKLQDIVEKLETSIAKLEQELAVQNGTYNELKMLYGNIGKSSQHEKRQSSGCDTTPVAFHSRLSADISPLGSRETITFDQVVTNLGNGYDTVTGLFEAPVDGVYEFIATIWSQSSNYLEAEMVHNGNDICFARATNYNQTMGTCVGIVQMSRGDRVWLRHYNGRGTYANGEGYPSFVGHRILV